MMVQSPAEDSSVISQYDALVLLIKVGESCKGILRAKASGGDGASERPQRKTSLDVATDFITKSCTWKYVFGTPAGVLSPPPPPRTGGEPEDAKPYDYNATKIIPKTMRNKWVAKFVFGDGNCAWRALAMAIWGTDVYWVQHKLVVLAWSVANTELLLAEGRAFYDDTKFFTDEIHTRYGRFEQGDDVSTSDNRFEMLIASVEYYTTNKTWGTVLGPL
ncbi:unnamed protein product [Pylaiella littoralis]